MKYISIPLLFIALASLLYVSVGQIACIGIDIQQAKQESAQNLSHTEKLSELIISAQDIRSGKAAWNGEHELKYDGKLYDIASSHESAGQIILKVRWDEKEEGLISELKTVIDGWLGVPQKDNSKQPVNRVADFFKDYIVASKFAFHFNSTFSCVSFETKQSVTTAPLLAVIKSPPQLG